MVDFLTKRTHTSCLRRHTTCTWSDTPVRRAPPASSPMPTMLRRIQRPLQPHSFPTPYSFVCGLRQIQRLMRQLLSTFREASSRQIMEGDGTFGCTLHLSILGAHHDGTGLLKNHGSPLRISAFHTLISLNSHPQPALDISSSAINHKRKSSYSPCSATFLY